MPKQVFFWLALFSLFFLLIYVFSAILLPFVIGISLAYFLDPVVDRMVAWRLPRSIAAGVVIIGFFIVAGVVLAILYPVAEREITGFSQRVPGYLNAAEKHLMPLIQRLNLPILDSETGGVSEFTGKILGVLGVKFAEFLGRFLSGGMALFNLFSLILISPVVAFYLMRDWDKLIQTVDHWLPRQHAETIREQLRAIDRVLSGFARGQALVSLTLGTLFAVGWSLVGLEFALVIGLLAGLLAFIPYAGALFALVIAMIVAVGQFGADYVQIGLIFGVFAIVQVIDSILITPNLLGGRVGLHSVWILFALLAGGAVFGLVGVFLAVPTAAVIGVLIKFGIEQYLASRFYRGDDDPRPSEALQRHRVDE